LNDYASSIVDALSESDLVTRKRPANVRSEMKMKKSILTFLGKTGYQENDWTDTLADLNKSIGLSPGDAAAYCARGYVLSSFGDFEGAVQDFSKAIELDPSYGEAYVTRGLTRIVLGDYGSAIQDSTIAIELDPSYAEAYVTRGLARRNLADYRGAIRDLNKAIETNNDLFQKHYNSGSAKNKFGDYAGAIHDFNRAIELYPNYSDMHFIRGITNIALQSFHEVIEVKPDYLHTYHNWDFDKEELGGYREHTSSYSLAYFGRGLAKSHTYDYSGAIEDYNYSILLNPELPVVYHKRGLAKSAMGDYGSAVRDFNKAIKINTVRQSATAAGFPYSELLHP